MTAAETISALVHLPDDAQVTVTVRKADLMRALERGAGGPQVMTTTEAHRALGYTRRQWQRWADAGEIDGAWQDAGGGPWRLPRASCEAKIAAMERRAAKRGGGTATSRRRRPHGPWKSRARTAPTKAALAVIDGRRASRRPRTTSTSERPA